VKNNHRKFWDSLAKRRTKRDAKKTPYQFDHPSENKVRIKFLRPVSSLETRNGRPKSRKTKAGGKTVGYFVVQSNPTRAALKNGPRVEAITGGTKKGT